MDEASGSSKVTVTDIDRGNSGDSTLLFTIHNAPKIASSVQSADAFKEENFHQ